MKFSLLWQNRPLLINNSYGTLARLQKYNCTLKYNNSLVNIFDNATHINTNFHVLTKHTKKNEAKVFLLKNPRKFMKYNNLIDNSFGSLGLLHWI